MAFITAEAGLFLQSMDRIYLQATVKSLTKDGKEKKRNGSAGVQQKVIIKAKKRI
jgi:hypothetical protein